MLGLEGAGAGEIQVVGLGGAECRELDPELVEVEGGDLLVQVLGQHIDLRELQCSPSFIFQPATGPF